MDGVDEDVDVDVGVTTHDSRLTTPRRHDATGAHRDGWMDRWHITETSMHRISDHGVHTQRNDVR